MAQQSKLSVLSANILFVGILKFLSKSELGLSLLHDLRHEPMGDQGMARVVRMHAVEEKIVR